MNCRIANTCQRMGFALLLLNAATGMAQISGEVVLANGNKLPAKIVSLNQDQVTFRSPLFQEQATLDRSLVRSVGFHGSDIDRDLGSFVFYFKSGARLQGRLVRLDSEQCWFESPRLGEIKVAVSALSEIRRSAPAEEMTTWTGATVGNFNGTLEVDSKGQMLIGPEVSVLKLPRKIEGLGTFEMEFQVSDDTDFQILLADDAGQTSTTINVSNGSLLVELKDDLKFGEFLPATGTVRLRCCWLNDGLHIQNQMGQSLLKLKHDGKATARVSIRNSGEPLSVSEISIGNKPMLVVPDQMASDQLIVWRSGRWRQGSSLKVKGGSVSLNAGDRSSGDFPIAELQRVWFGPMASSEKSTADGLSFCAWAMGDRFACEQLEFAGGQGRFVSPEFQSTGVFRTLPSVVAFSNTAKASEDSESSQRLQEAASPFRLSIGGVGFAGVYSWGDERNPLRWQFFGFDESVTLNVDRKIEMTRVAKPSMSSSVKAADRLLLKDGAIVPCQIQTANQDGFRLQSNHTDTSQVPVSNVQCCFFDVTDTNWKNAVTNESIQRALTLPRMSKDLQFSHVLIGRNGDLLRGNLVAIYAEKIEFESRFEPLLIDRENVVGIIWISDGEVAEDRAKSVELPSGETTNVTAQIDCGDSFVAVGRYVSLNDQAVVVDSSVLGRMTVPVNLIRQVTFNSRTENASALQAFAKWQLKNAGEPRWVAELPVAAKANELLNTPAVDFEMPLMSDSEQNDVFRLSDHLGKVVVLNFWRTTSKPSLLGMPEYLDVARRFSPNDVTFVGINTGEPASRVNQCLRANQWGTLKSIADTQLAVADKYNVTGIPHLTIIDQQGNIRVIKVGYSRTAAEELKKEIQQLLAN